MTQRQLTPGPWVASKVPSSDWYVTPERDGVITGPIIACVPFFCRMDAHLIAAAPELMDALHVCMRAMVPAFDRLHCLPRSTDTVAANNIDHALGIARAAITKATGVEP